MKRKRAFAADYTHPRSISKSNIYWLSQYNQILTEYLFSWKFLPHPFYKFLTTKHSPLFIPYQHVVIIFKYCQVRDLCKTNMSPQTRKIKVVSGFHLRPFRILEKVPSFSQKEQFCNKMSDGNVTFVL